MIIIDSNYFYAAVLVYEGKVNTTAPILNFMIGWTQQSVIDYCVKKKWKYILD